MEGHEVNAEGATGGGEPENVHTGHEVNAEGATGGGEPENVHTGHEVNAEGATGGGEPENVHTGGSSGSSNILKDVAVSTEDDLDEYNPRAKFANTSDDISPGECVGVSSESAIKSDDSESSPAGPPPSPELDENEEIPLGENDSDQLQLLAGVHATWCASKRRVQVPALVSSSSLDRGSKLRGPSPIDLLLHYSVMAKSCGREIASGLISAESSFFSRLFYH
ncbi:hypothetical protein TNCV_258131 [Trichonephila clavipes]|uniref:Uncharacterized protein n=1 Tax=Trichonephila clavipes TaxID=2585209 RepID=A0A8X6RVQ9_TRICX|nr:hypothetical protein TNCV_258131 [Trichonephila clavipes]